VVTYTTPYNLNTVNYLIVVTYTTPYNLNTVNYLIVITYTTHSRSHTLSLLNSYAVALYVARMAMTRSDPCDGLPLAEGGGVGGGGGGALFATRNTRLSKTPRAAVSAARA